MNKHKKTALVLCACLIMVGCLAGAQLMRWNTGGVHISEVRIDGNAALYDAYTSYHGFIELHNDSDQAISLDGWYLSDSLINPQKYQIQNLQIQPDEYVVFWTHTAEDFSYLPTEVLLTHFLGFSLDETDYAILSSPEGKVIDKIAIPHLEPETSYARNLAGHVWAIRESTPGSGNSAQAILNTSVPNAPVFSLPAGFYEEDRELTITAPKNCTIYYTTDGSTPTTASAVYESPVLLTDVSAQPNKYASYSNISIPVFSVYTPSDPVPKANVIRAIAVDTKGRVSQITTGTYFIGHSEKYGFEDVQILSIVTDPENLFGEEFGIYVTGDAWTNYGAYGDYTISSKYYTAITNYGLSGQGWRRPISLELFNANGKKTSSQPGAIGIHGNWSVVYNQKSFNLYAASENGETDALLPEIFAGDRDSLMLRAGGYRDLYSTKLRDVLNQKLVEDRAIGIQRSVPCQVFINGEYWGLYNLQERLDETYIAANYGVNKNNVILLKNATVVAGEQAEYDLYAQVVNYAAEHDLSQQEYYDQMCKWIDIQSYIDYYCFQIYVANVDSVGNNYALWRTRYAVDDGYGDGKWRWILYDTDDSVGMVENGRSDVAIDSFSNPMSHWSVTPMQDTLFSALIQNTQFKLQFAETFIEMANTCFNYERVEAVLDELCKVYCPCSVVSHQRFLDEDYTEEDYMAQIQVVKDFYRQRFGYIYQHMIWNLGLKEYGYE